MSVLWPRLTRSIATAEYEAIKVEGVRDALSHPAQIYAPVGGRHVTDGEIALLKTELMELAAQHAFPNKGSDLERTSFDRLAAEVLYRHMSLTWSEAASRDVWSFLSIVALPHLTEWRFGVRNSERWVASDLTRHTWARLWWQYVTFKSDPGLLEALSESDLNQLLERRTIGGDIRLVCALARGLVFRTEDGEARRALVRDVTARMRRRIAFTSTSALSSDQLNQLVSDQLDLSEKAIAN